MLTKKNLKKITKPKKGNFIENKLFYQTQNRIVGVRTSLKKQNNTIIILAPLNEIINYLIFINYKNNLL